MIVLMKVLDKMQYFNCEEFEYQDYLEVQLMGKAEPVSPVEESAVLGTFRAVAEREKNAEVSHDADRLRSKSR